ncbi:hypothetical protein BS50DRAFT_490739 [Corynespora cassiicola Philippines]|uniref:F-box domain-containing protein n=1 Tax=Corynespora cassiicola Philippines TaxID=1448308 RepID=A0A2T2NV49_CORCC|nr:hypothetical protein BS50DRAFT_490739 [Corynespora cassiicola Philippines]
MSECYLYRLPNELLLHLLKPFPTPELLPLTVLSHRLYAIVLRIIHNRLVAAAELTSHSVLLECYHPSAKYTEPPYFCTYRDTEGLSLYENLSENDADISKRLGQMRNMYSRFRPYRRELERGGRRVRGPPGDVPGSRTFPGEASDRYEGDTVKQMLNLEGHELFTQLVAQCHLAKLGPRNGIFLSIVEVEEGNVRVWRDWLKEMAKSGLGKVRSPQQEVVEVVGKGNEVVREVTEEKANSAWDDILWVSASKNTGFRLNVKEKKLRRDIPIMVRTDEEDMPVSYEIEYDELLIRTSHLLLMLEKSLLQEDNTSGKAMVFGYFG